MSSSERTVPEAGVRVNGDVGTVIDVPEYIADPLTNLTFDM